MYIKEIINKLFEDYPKSLTKSGNKLLTSAAKKKEKNDYNDLKYDIGVGKYDDWKNFQVKKFRKLKVKKINDW